MKNTKIMMIVQNDFVNDSRIIKEATALGKEGYIVKVFALHNKGLKEDEDFTNFTVKRIKLSTRDRLGKNKFAQIIKYIEFQNKCVDEANKFLPDIIHCHDVYTLPIGNKIINKLKAIKKIKFVYDSHELWSHASNNLSMPKVLLKVQNSMEKSNIKKCNKVITVSKSIVRYLKERYNLKNDPILLRNIPYRFNNIENKKLLHKDLNIPLDKKIVLYQGAVGVGRGIEKLIDAMKFLDDSIVLVILGNGSKVNSYKELVKNNNLQNRVYFHSAVSPDVLINYTSSADLGVSMIKNICLSYYYSLPNKMFEYIQSEIPVICSNYPDMKEIVEEYKVGRVADPCDSKDISKAINDILYDKDTYNKFKENCKLAKKQLNWEKESENLIQLYKDIITE